MYLKEEYYRAVYFKNNSEQSKLFHSLMPPKLFSHTKPCSNACKDLGPAYISTQITSVTCPIYANVHGVVLPCWNVTGTWCKQTIIFSSTMRHNILSGYSHFKLYLSIMFSGTGTQLDALSHIW